jgi:peptidoglycan/LPS O-acetylase OafA/YrhL
VSPGVRQAARVCALLGGALAVLASFDAWHAYAQGGVTTPETPTRVLLVALALAILAGSVVTAVRESETADRVVAACAGGLAGLLLITLLTLGGQSDEPGRGGWLAGGAVALTGIGAIVLGWGPYVRSGRLLAALAAVTVAVAVGAVILPPDHRDIEVIR